MQNDACKDAHDALTEGGLERSKTLPVLGFPYENACFWDARTLRCCEAAGGKRRSHEARSAALCARPLLLRSRPFMARALAGHQNGRAALPDLMAAGNAADLWSMCAAAGSHAVELVWRVGVGEGRGVGGGVGGGSSSESIGAKTVF